jgi:hypothetical protein
MWRLIMLALPVAAVAAGCAAAAAGVGDDRDSSDAGATLFIWETAIVGAADAPAYESTIEELARHYAAESHAFPHVVFADDTTYHSLTGIASWAALAGFAAHPDTVKQCARLRHAARAYARSSTLRVLRLRPGVAAADLASSRSAGNYFLVEIAHLRPGTDREIEENWAGWTALFDSLGIDFWWMALSGELGFAGPAYVGIMVAKDAAEITAKQGRMFQRAGDTARGLQQREVPLYRWHPEQGGVEFISGTARPEWSHWPDAAATAAR